MKKKKSLLFFIIQAEGGKSQTEIEFVPGKILGKQKIEILIEIQQLFLYFLVEV